MKIDSLKRKEYTNEGFMILPDFVSMEELISLRKICDVSIKDIESDMVGRGVVRDRINVYGKKYFIPNVWKEHSNLKSIIFNEKFVEVCKNTIGNTAYIHNDQFVVKMQDKETSFAWHQDSGYSSQGGAAPHKPYFTCWIALDDMSLSNGTISILPFSRSPSRKLIEHFWDSEANAMVGYQGNDQGDLVEVTAGTLVAFSSLLLHKSGANYTDNPRRSYFIAFTPELLYFANNSKRVYSSGEPFLKEGKLIPPST